MRALLLCLLLVASRAPAAEPTAAPAPSLAAFASLPEDPAPRSLVRGSHYWVSNEDHLEFFHDVVQGKGGVYVGVGTDQNYLMAAWARAEALVLMDFDQSIVDLHRVYRVLFRQAATPTEFLRLWRKASRKEVQELIEAGTPDPQHRKRALQAYAIARWSVERRLLKLVGLMAQVGRPCFLSEAAQYEHVRRLYLEDKVFMVRGDLTARQTVAAIGEAVRKSGLKLTVLYLSNAEQYFPYREQYRQNIRALPLEEGSVVLRTSGMRGLSYMKGTYYHYNTQTGPSFLAWLGDAKTRDAHYMMKRAPKGTVRGLSHLDAGPAEVGKDSKSTPKAVSGAGVR